MCIQECHSCCRGIPGPLATIVCSLPDTATYEDSRIFVKKTRHVLDVERPGAPPLLAETGAFLQGCAMPALGSPVTAACTKAQRPRMPVGCLSTFGVAASPHPAGLGVAGPRAAMPSCSQSLHCQSSRIVHRSNAAFLQENLQERRFRREEIAPMYGAGFKLSLNRVAPYGPANACAHDC